MRLTDWLGRFFWLGILGMLCSPVAVPAAQLNFQSDTLFRFFQQDTATKKDANVSPVYEFMQLDIGTPNQPGFAFHIYGWGRGDLANSHYYSKAATGQLLYGYMEYKGRHAHFNARLGRQQIFEGVSNESVDGLHVSSDLGPYFSGSVYAGQPVAFDNIQGSSGDSIFGGRLSQHLAGLYDLGLSYKKVRNNSTDATEKTGLDISAFLPYGVNLYGYSMYNMDTDQWGESSYELNFAIGRVRLRPYIRKFRYADYFGTGTTAQTANTSNSVNPFRFLANTGEVLTIGGADLTMPVNASWTLAFKAKHYDYKVLEGYSQYYSAQATWSGKGQSQIGSEFGLMHGNVAENRYYLLHLFTYWDQLPHGSPLKFISGDVVYVGYDEAIYGKDNSLFISLGTGRKFLNNALELKVSGDYSRDPYFDGDLRGMFTVSYHFKRKL